eukprot:226080-Prymnesium_polylepis.1
MLTTPQIGNFAELSYYVDGKAQCTLALLYSGLAGAALFLFPLYVCLYAQEETWGRSRWQWRMLGMNLLSLQVSQMGFEDLDKCPAFGLPEYCIVFGWYNSAQEVFNIVSNAQREEMA